MIVETLKVFVTVAEQSNFSRAAELLNLSQPGVSLHIRNLEQELGARLMLRSPKYVKLTEAGQILYHHAKQILSLYEEAKRDIHLLQEIVTGSIQIGASFTIGEYILPRFLAEFAGQYPQVELQVTIGNTEEVVQAIRMNQLQLGLVEGHVTASDVIATPFMTDEMILVTDPHHPLAAADCLDPHRLDNQIWVLRENGSGTRAFSDRFLQQSGLTPKRFYVFNSSQGVKEAVAAGLGIAILSRWVVSKELESGELAEIPLQGPRLVRHFSIVEGRESAGSASLAVDRLIQNLMVKKDSLTIQEPIK